MRSMYILIVFLLLVPFVSSTDFNSSDADNPIADFILPNSSINLSSTVIVNVTLNGTGTGISSAFFFFNGSMVANYTNSTNTAGCYNYTFEMYSCYFSATVANSSTYNLTINFSDYGGTSGNNILNFTYFTVDTTLPYITFVNFSSYNSNNSLALIGDLVYINFTSSEPLNISRSYVVVLGHNLNVTNIAGNSYTANYTINLSDTESQINYTIVLYDLAGNSNSTTNTSKVFFDQLPTGSFTHPSTSSIYLAPSTENFTIHGLANDSFSGIKNITIYVNDVENGSVYPNFNATSAVWNYTIFGLTDGSEYNITINITDNNLNLKRINATIVSDNFRPAIIVTNPLNGTIYYNTTGSMMRINFTLTENSNNISMCWFNLFGESFNNTNVTFSCSVGNVSTLTYLQTGNYSLILYANDSFGNLNYTSPINFSVNDTMAPVMSNPLPSGAQSSSTSSVTLSIVTNENATCRYKRNSDTDYASMTESFSSNATNHTASFGVTAGSSHTFYVRCMDLSGNMNTASSTISFTVSAANSTSSTSSSSSGGGSTSTSTGNTSSTSSATSASVIVDTLVAGTNTITVDSTAIPMKEISVVVLKSLSLVKFTVSVVESPSSSQEYSGDVYKYMQVDHPSLPDSNISSAKLKFKIPKSWLDDNSISKTNIILLRYSGSAWDSLETYILSEDDEDVEYVAKSPGLSLFAISYASGTSADVTAADTDENLSEEIASDSTNNSESSQATGDSNTRNSSADSLIPVSKTSILGSGLGWKITVLIILILGAIGGFYYMKRMHSPDNSSASSSTSSTPNPSRDPSSPDLQQPKDSSQQNKQNNASEVSEAQRKYWQKLTPQQKAYVWQQYRKQQSQAQQSKQSNSPKNNNKKNP